MLNCKSPLTSERIRMACGDSFTQAGVLSDVRENHVVRREVGDDVSLRINGVIIKPGGAPHKKFRVVL